MSKDDRNVIAHLEERLAQSPDPSGDALAELEMLADLYIQADSHLPALETIDRLLSLPAARTLSATRRAALESKAISCRIAQGQVQAALAQCREVLQRESTIESPQVRSRLHLQCSAALFQLGRLAESRESADRALALADTCGDLALSAQAINYQGRTLYREGDLTGARDHYEHALALYRRVGDEASSAHLRNNLGLIHKNLCEWETAAAHLTAALEIHRAASRFGEAGYPLMHLGIVYQKSGDWTRAQEHYVDAERVFSQVGDQLGLVRTGIGLGNVARLQRRFSDAETLLLAALERARVCGARREEVLAMEFLGEVDFDRGRAAHAITRYDEALPMAERIAPEGDLVVELERRRAEALLATGRLEDAEAACARALRLARVTDDRLEHAVAHRVAGDIAAGRGRREESTEMWRSAALLLTQCRERLELGRTYLALGRATEDPREARRHLYLAGGLFSELGSAHWLEQSESELQRLLGPTDPAPMRPASLLGRRHRAPSLVASSGAMYRVENLARRAAMTELSVLITGETGTGKELIARTIHSLSTRAQRPFLAINCGALRADLALSQLFGHRKGAFTGAHAEGIGLVEAAHGGTLFLDEVGELPHDVQVTLLRFLESGEYLRLGETQVRRADVRMIAATNRELRGDAGERVFRRDLLFRLNEIEILVPTLADRLDDVVPLARHFLAFYGGIDGPRLAADAEAVLTSYAWPGNVRELENVMKRVAALHSGDTEVDADSLLPFLAHPPLRTNGDVAVASDERSAILSAYREAHGNKSRVAELLGVSRKTLYARIRRLNIDLH